MKTAVQITLLLLAAAGVINWMRAGDDFTLPELFPLLGGFDIGFFDLAGATVLVIAVWGWVRISRPPED